MEAHVEIVPNHLIKDLTIAAGFTDKLLADLNSGVVKAASEYVPEGTAMREDIIKILENAQHDFEILKQLLNKNGTKGYFQRLGADVAALHNGTEKHTPSWWVRWFEKVFHDISGGK